MGMPRLYGNAKQRKELDDQSVAASLVPSFCPFLEQYKENRSRHIILGV
jgi:hypothetical protein